MARSSGSRVCYSSGSSGLLVEAIAAVLADDGFKVPSPEAAAALSTATALLSWCREPQNNSLLRKFSKRLTCPLLACLGEPSLSISRRKVKMLSLYHQLRTSEKFKEDWKEFLTISIGSSEAAPAFFQYVTSRLFQSIVHEEFQVPQSSHYNSDSTTHLSPNDQSALRYVAGYVCRKVRDKLEKSSIAHKNDLILTLYEFRGHCSVSHHGSEDWVNALDRGGLWHVTDDVFLFFCYIEEEIRKHLSVTSLRNEGIKMEIIEGLKRNEDVLFQWCILSTDLDDDLSVVLRDKIIELYVTIRGFAFANSCMELYKQSKQETVQKSKATRRKVYESQNQ